MICHQKFWFYVKYLGLMLCLLHVFVWDASPTAALKLVQGPAEHLGNIALTILGENYSVCDHGWNDDAANAVCRMLGYRYGLLCHGT